jgi:hypothetical protein
MNAPAHPTHAFTSPPLHTALILHRASFASRSDLQRLGTRGFGQRASREHIQERPRNNSPLHHGSPHRHPYTSSAFLLLCSSQSRSDPQISRHDATRSTSRPENPRRHAPAVQGVRYQPASRVQSHVPLQPSCLRRAAVQKEDADDPSLCAIAQLRRSRRLRLARACRLRP